MTKSTVEIRKATEKRNALYDLPHYFVKFIQSIGTFSGSFTHFAKPSTIIFEITHNFHKLIPEFRSDDNHVLGRYI